MLQYTEMLKNDEDIFNEKAKQLGELQRENAQMVNQHHNQVSAVAFNGMRKFAAIALFST